jgi:hypothetical protein
MPLLADGAVADTVLAAASYQAIRQALLALSGIALMQSLGRADPGALAGVVATARSSVGAARDGLARPRRSRVASIQLRARLLAGACDRLDDQLGLLVDNGHEEVPWRLLNDVRGVLASTSLVEAGMRQFGSTGCSAYLGLVEHARLLPDSPTHPHPHSHAH